MEIHGNLMDDPDGERYIWWCPELSPIVEITCENARTHARIGRQLAAIDGLRFGWQFGDRRKSFGPVTSSDPISFSVDVRDANDLDVGALRLKNVPYRRFVQVVRVPRYRDYMGVAMLRLRDILKLTDAVPAKLSSEAFRYEVNLNSLKKQRPRARR